MGALVGVVRGSAVVLLGVALALALLAPPAGGQEAPDPRPAPPFTLQGSGEGHGVGMSQWGARALARNGSSHVGILEHFYTGVSVGPHPAGGGAVSVLVGLFHGNPAVADRTVVALSALRDDAGGAVDVQLAPGAAPTRVPAGQTWTVSYDEGLPILVPPGLVLLNTEGSIVARGAGPATVTFAAQDTPALRMPQIAEGAQGFDGTLLRGVLAITREAETGIFHPVVHLPLEEYLLGVDEIPASWAEEAVKAQAVAARTFAARRVAGGLNDECGCHVGVTAAHQVYAGYAQEGDPQRAPWATAVTETAGQVVTSGGELIDAVYSAAHAGRSENVEESWAFGGRSFPYLRSVDDPWVTDAELAAAYPAAAWTHEVPHDILAERAGLATITKVEIVQRTIGGTPRVLSLSGWDADGERVTGRLFSGDTIRVAGAELYLAMRAQGDPPPSQQFGVIGFSSFPDVSGRSVHAYNVAAIAEQGVTTGRADGTYDPQAGVRRDQMATFIARALDLPLDPAAPDRFDDVSRGSVHRDAINAVAAAGIAQGVAPRRYAPHATVTRDQMATFIARAFDLGENNRDRFTDTEGSVHRARINAIADEGITGGCRVDRFCPRLPVTRAQMASFLARALGFGW